MKRYPKRCSVQDRNPNKQCLFTPSNILRKLILSNRKLKFLTERAKTWQNKYVFCQTFINDILWYWTDTFIDMAMRYIQMHNSLRWGIRDTEKHSKHNQRNGIFVFIIITNIKPSHYIHKFYWNILAKTWKETIWKKWKTIILRIQKYVFYSNMLPWSYSLWPTQYFNSRPKAPC